MSHVAERAIAKIAGYLETCPSRIGANDSFEELGLDSLDMLYIVGRIEGDIRIVFDDSALEAVETVADLIALAERTRRP